MTEADIARFFTHLKTNFLNSTDLLGNESFIFDLGYYSGKTDEVVQRYSRCSFDEREVIFNNLVNLMPLSNDITEKILTNTAEDQNRLQSAYSDLYAVNSKIMQLLSNASKSLDGKTTRAFQDSLNKTQKVEGIIKSSEEKIVELKKDKKNLQELNRTHDALKAEIKSLELEADEESLKKEITRLAEKRDQCKEIVKNMRRNKDEDQDLNRFLNTLPEFLRDDETSPL